MSYLSGTNIYLRAIEPEDLDILYQWENDSSLWVHGCTLAPFSKFKTVVTIFIRPDNYE